MHTLSNIISKYTLFKTIVKSIQKQNYFSLNIAYLIFLLNLLCSDFLQIMLYMVQCMLAVLLKTQAQGKKKYEVYLIIFRSLQIKL